ncbi:ankyrin repeat protein [Rhizodiscina lignyota]|uniref:Ankyrin repeat protein n=1 Tax=Rhizodiscina lignyota TaxID=1504668 RepID=A0A9P4M0F8_9PEZI|nr:ankyrin repeat protein [Rhizodiscina lignyota]
MATQAALANAHSQLPHVPVPVESFLTYLSDHPKTPVEELLLPYRQYDAKAREVFAQESNHPALADHHINVVPLFGPDGSTTLKVRARNLGTESEQQQEKYIMPLKDEDRKKDGSPAIVPTLRTFRDNFNVFSELSLSELDWSNVVAAGSSVVSALLPTPAEYSASKRSLRKYYHEISAPASDVDLFLYGLTEKEAVEKIKQIEGRVRDALLTETTTIRTKNAITIASQYPTRHVQIVLRIYKSVSEILTGFDVDCSCAAYDGKQVYASPRAVAAYMTQTNTIDLSRRSPSYENRLSKYSHRGFEICWPQLDRSLIDPTIFERSFNRTNGLARLLVLEKLPKPTDRDAYMDQRRQERGRPPINRFVQSRKQLRGNIKNDHEDEVAEWVEEDEVSDYHTFTIPYGERFHAKRIEKVLYTKDLLLNAEWNKPKDREVNLHRHPAFFGNVVDVIEDCCGSCPKPMTPEEVEVAEEESKRYVSGKISFMKDDPGRQAIGSFNPITDTDWTEMAYVGETERLCQAIVDCDLDRVKDWFAVDGADPNCRDYTGRTPLQLAIISSTPEIVQCLVDNGARLVARMADGRTALHLAAALGRLEMVRILMFRSEANEAEEEEKEDAKRKARDDESEEADEEESDEDYDMTDGEDDQDVRSSTTGSYVKVTQKVEADAAIPDDNEEDEPDFYDINVLAWDTPASALHLAIINGHVEVVTELVQTFGADVLLPVKLLNSYGTGTPRAAILTLVLALTLPMEKAKQMTTALLKLGASSAQADLKQHTAFEYFVDRGVEMMDVLLENDQPAIQRVLNHIAVSDNFWNPSGSSPLTTAINNEDPKAVLKLLELGAHTTVDFSEWVKSMKIAFDEASRYDSETNEKQFKQSFSQPLIVAITNEQPSIAMELLNHGADPNTLTPEGNHCVLDQYYRMYNSGGSALDLVQEKLKTLREAYKAHADGNRFRNENAGRFSNEPKKPEPLEQDDYYVSSIPEGSYQRWAATEQLQRAKALYDSEMKMYADRIKEKSERKGMKEKMAMVANMINEMESLEKQLLEKGAKTFKELHPNLTTSQPNNQQSTFNSLGFSGVNAQKFGIKFSFQVPDLSSATRQAYIEIFEAAWRGDLDAIKTYTLGPWGAESKESPLLIAVKDMAGSSPFSIAVLRGHVDTAKGILEIAQAQYAPKEPVLKRYEIDDEEDEDVHTDESEAEDEIRVYSEIIDERFTIDNIGEVATQVKSRVKPQSMMTWGPNISHFVEMSGSSKLADHYATKLNHSMFDFAVILDDLEMFKWLLELYSKHAKLTGGDGDFLKDFAHTSNGAFLFALRLGHTRILAELIKHTGAGIPLEELVEKSGVEVKRKPKYYQGLTVYGKKRADWAASARGVHVSTFKSDMLPPLLVAAHAGNLESVEWFLSDTPKRCYSEFAEANKDSILVKTLEKAPGGFDVAVSGFLEKKNHLAIHCAVLSKPSVGKEKLVKYLISAFPQYLDTKSASGYTPLHLAFSLQHPRIAKLLIANGANQKCRDLKGNNLIHSLLLSGNDFAKNKAQRTRDLLELIDPALLPSLFTERCSEEPGSLTPLHRWILKASGYTNDTARFAEFLDLVLEYSKGVELDTINGAGDTPLHTIVSKKSTRLLTTIATRRPDLLHRENAIGRTPVDVRFDNDNARKLANPPSNFQRNRRGPLADKDPIEFAPKELTEPEPDWDEAWATALGVGSKKRKLVSLFEANEVARRLTAREVKKRRMEYGQVVNVNDPAPAAVDELHSWYWTYVGCNEIPPQTVS